MDELAVGVTVEEVIVIVIGDDRGVIEMGVGVGMDMGMIGIVTEIEI